jgi:hypothetical protein
MWRLLLKLAIGVLFLLQTHGMIRNKLPLSLQIFIFMKSRTIATSKDNFGGRVLSDIVNLHTQLITKGNYTVAT